ncbi:unnamed protein product [Gongylonema pulchrum]|uniref:S4 RNA-binding domain-containing protein n=1 Tax=Gongylonema pulchrum TaxID=637853 RepID=A0A183CZL2_9BILA|nr:unnamed protein product [Gongylonema pulchrum]
MRKHGRRRDDEFSSASATKWRKSLIPYLSQLKNTKPKSPKGKDVLRPALQRSVFELVEDTTQRSPEAPLVDEPGTISILLADQHGLQVEVAASIGLHLVGEDGTRREIKCNRDRKVLVNGRVIYEE